LINFSNKIIKKGINNKLHDGITRMRLLTNSATDFSDVLPSAMIKHIKMLMIHSENITMPLISAAPGRT
jgi:hypothetical protein